MPNRRVIRNTFMVMMLMGATAIFVGAMPAQPPQGGMPNLPEGLRNTPGCLGVTSGQMEDGKQVIFAWFENKSAVRKWYYSEMHQGIMESMAPGLNPEHGPLNQVEDDEGPIMVIASLTMSDKPAFESMPNMPISQISIELYKPLPGGAFLGERFAPSTVKVGNMRDLTSPTEEGED